jgi:hypothetical protein
MVHPALHNSKDLGGGCGVPVLHPHNSKDLGGGCGGPVPPSQQQGPVWWLRRPYSTLITARTWVVAAAARFHPHNSQAAEGQQGKPDLSLRIMVYMRIAQH